MKKSNIASFRRRVSVRDTFLVFAASMLSLTATTAAFAQPVPSFQDYKPAQIYRRAPAASPDQSQIVFFRTGGQPLAGNDAAHVYVDGELQGALMPDGFTRFCVKPGTHSIEAYIGDAPLYAGKADPRTEINLEGGATYFIGVSDSGTGEPVPYRRVDAERLLRNSHEQNYIINRASAVVPCGAQTEVAAPPLAQFTVSAKVLFGFAQSSASSITTAGRNELRKIAEQILALPPNAVARVSVVGHTDPIGSESYNQKLSEDRAQTVGQILSQYGIPRGLIHTAGIGSGELVTHCPSAGDRAKRIGCNAPNRRVEISVEGTRPDEDS